MSLYTMQLMQESYRREEAAIDARERRRAQERKTQLPEEEIAKQGEELYAKVVKVIKRDYKPAKGRVSVSCALRPNSVFDYVVKKLKEKGWNAKHHYNDGYNDYDHIDCSPPKYDPTEML